MSLDGLSDGLLLFGKHFVYYGLSTLMHLKCSLPTESWTFTNGILYLLLPQLLFLSLFEIVASIGS